MGDMQQLDFDEIANRIKLIRLKILKVSQADFAIEIGATQVQISRLEKGKGVTIDLILSIINYLNHKGYNGYMIFVSFFELDMITKKSFDAEIMIESLKHFKSETLNSINQLIGKAQLM